MRYLTTRTIDELGRVTLPIELRRELNWKDGESIDVFIDGGYAVFKPKVDKCVICENEKNLKQVKNKSICSNCLFEVCK